MKLTANIAGFSIIVTFACAIFFGLRAISLAQHDKFVTYDSAPQERENQGSTAYDRRQDDRMTSADERELEREGERKERYQEIVDHNKIYDAKLDEDHDRIVRDEAYFAGAMGLLAFLQIYLKLVKKEPTLPFHRNNIRRNDSPENEQGGRGY